MPARILVVDDEIGMQIALREVLQRQGYEVTVAGDGMAALEAIEQQDFDLVVSDVRMPEVGGLELLEKVALRRPGTPFLIITAYGTIEDAVTAMKKGASDYLLKPFSSEAVEEAVRRQLERKRLEQEQAPPEEQDAAEGDESPAPAGRGQGPIAVSEASRMVLEMAREVADSTATILVQGESGTGKEVLARFIHHHSGRAEAPFVAVNCAALPEGLLESELFGHEKGAFTGAVLSRKGKFELAHRGTLLLDEISEMPLALQAKLLRVLQEREIDPVGAQRPVSVDVRVIATTNRNLAEYVSQGHFREDLFYRLQVINLALPPLRERREDILPLAEHFVRRHCRANRRPLRKIGTEMRRYLVEQPWRGNVRELENFLERAVLLCKDDEIRPDRLYLDALSQPMAPSAPLTREVLSPSTDLAGPARPSAALAVQHENEGARVDRAMASILQPGELVTLEEMERRMILHTLDQVEGNRTRAADLLGVSVRTIRNKLNQYNQDSDEENSASLSAG